LSLLKFKGNRNRPTSRVEGEFLASTSLGQRSFWDGYKATYRDLFKTVKGGAAFD